MFRDTRIAYIMVNIRVKGPFRVRTELDQGERPRQSSPVMFFSLLYRLVRRALELVRLRVGDTFAKEAEILVLVTSSRFCDVR